MEASTPVIKCSLSLEQGLLMLRRRSSIPGTNALGENFPFQKELEDEDSLLHRSLVDYGAPRDGVRR
jgi:hypothetical protein